MDIQRLRTLTTGKMHTESAHVYEDLEYITGQQGIMTHQIVRIMQSVEPWLRLQISDERFWDGQYDPSHVGEVELRQMTPDEFEEAFKRFSQMSDPLAAKQVVSVAAE